MVAPLNDIIFIPHWDDEPNEWDFVKIEDQLFLLSEWPQFEAAKKTDKKSASGRNGGRIANKGYKPSEITITLQLWSSQDLEEFLKLLPKISPKRHESNSAVRIYHPILSAHSITQMFVTSVSSLKNGSGHGIYTVTIKATEWTEPKKHTSSTVTPTSPFVNARTAFNTPSETTANQPTQQPTYYQLTPSELQ